MLVWPPGGAKTRDVGRPVITLGPLALAPDAKAFADTAPDEADIPGSRTDEVAVGTIGFAATSSI
jgi:hypothetical protein